MDLNEIMKEAAVVRDETADGRNTAQRVGNVLCHIVEAMGGDSSLLTPLFLRFDPLLGRIYVKAGDTDWVSADLWTPEQAAVYCKDEMLLRLPDASIEASGLLSAADKQQLDTIAYWKSGISQTVDELKDEVGLINTLTSRHEENIADLQNADTRRQKLVPAVAYVVQNAPIETTSSSSSSGIVYDATRQRFLNAYAGKYYLAIPPGADPDRVFSNPPTGQLYAFGQNVLSGQAGYPAGLYRWDGSKPVQQSASTPATTSASGLLSAADKQLLAHAADLGTFSAAADMWESAADFEYVADPAIALLFGTIGDQSAVIVQQYDKSRTMQYAYWDKKHYNRNIDHTDTEVTYVAPWKQDCIDHIYYNPQTRIIHQRNRWNDTLTGGPLSTLPLASGSVAGLMSAADKQALSTLQQQVTVLSRQIELVQSLAQQSVPAFDVIVPSATVQGSSVQLYTQIAFVESLHQFAAIGTDGLYYNNWGSDGYAPFNSGAGQTALTGRIWRLSSDGALYYFDGDTLAPVGLPS